MLTLLSTFCALIADQTKEITLYTKEQCDEHGLVFDTAHQRWHEDVVRANATIVPGQAASWVNVETIDGRSGTGWAFLRDEVSNIADVVNITGGTLVCRSWDILKSTSNMIQVFAMEGHLYITFIADDGVAGHFAGAGAGEETFQGNGVFNWN
ncbi:hypothetical protein EW146_g10084 [Bondarzewia mesenterica]|uniref:Uncharacterized protein n=1 Tax=Bondarzewia mesenterica TaxID=1095465 RepID=A0A4S4L143_9AGAM|nr:hypothetical protein EW146_g10084 [Bondarzewia mesenterica]